MIEKKELEMEKEDPAAAATAYEKILKKEKLNTHAYNRMMIVYRKQKQYKKEAALIQRAIIAFEEFYKKHQPSRSKKVISLSKALSTATGLSTKNGKPLHDPEPIATWKIRLANLKKKM